MKGTVQYGNCYDCVLGARGGSEKWVSAISQTTSGDKASLNIDVVVENNHETYRLAVIDILTPYDLKKMVENKAKSKIYGTGNIVCVPPKLYAERFAAFMKTDLVQDLPMELQGQ